VNSGKGNARGRPLARAAQAGDHRLAERRAWQALVAHHREVWSIDSFDQWGVGLGKKLAERTVAELESAHEPKLAHDSATNALIRRYRRVRGREASSS
jgi:hypothetical protein